MDPISMDSLLAKLHAARQAASALPNAAPNATASAPAKQADFGAMLKGSIARVDQMQGTASALAEQFQLGDPKVSLEDTMISLQKANISFQAMVQVRNKVVAAYHDIMNMQI